MARDRSNDPCAFVDGVTAMTIKDGGPAFPCSEERWINPMNINEGTYYPDGMTLRDYFAAKAMQGIVTHANPWGLGDTGRLAHMAYEIADEMLKART